MTHENRKAIIQLLEKTINYEYPIRWVDEKTTLGDFDGREFAIDIFRISVSEQLNFLKKIRTIREKIFELAENRCIFIFHTLEATKKYYSHLFPVAEGGFFSKPIKISLSDFENNKSQITGSVYFKYRQAA